jgi:hypothetical protein
MTHHVRFMRRRNAPSGNSFHHSYNKEKPGKQMFLSGGFLRVRLAKHSSSKRFIYL